MLRVVMCLPNARSLDKVGYSSDDYNITSALHQLVDATDEVVLQCAWADIMVFFDNWFVDTSGDEVWLFTLSLLVGFWGTSYIIMG